MGENLGEPADHQGTVNFKNTPATLNISNYEMGIVFPLRESHKDLLTAARRNTSSIADNVAAHKRPPRPYGKTDEPWVNHAGSS